MQDMLGTPVWELAKVEPWPEDGTESGTKIGTCLRAWVRHGWGLDIGDAWVGLGCGFGGSSSDMK